MKPAIFILLLIMLLITAFVLCVGKGALQITPGQALAIMGNKLGLSIKANYTERQEAVLMAIRIPRVLLGLLIGATLSVSGTAIQGLFRNPLADAGLIGISSGASLAAIAAIVLSLPVVKTLQNVAGLYTLSIVTFIGAFLTTQLVYLIARSNGKVIVSTMLLSGIAIGSIATALTGVIILYANEVQLRNVTFWTLGSLGGANWLNLMVLLPFSLITVIGLTILSKSLNAFVLGETNAGYLGLNVERLKNKVVILTALGVGAAVSVAGIIGFIGLVVPHVIRLIIGPENKKLMIASALAGAMLLMVADLVCRTVIAPAEIPIGAATALVGGPFFLYMLIKDKRKHSIL